MSVTIQTEPNNNYVEIRMTGQVTGKDYENFLPVINKEIERCGRICLLVIMHDFKGWDMESGWEETKFMFGHFSKIDRVGIVGASEWQKWMAFLSKPFTQAEIKYFTPEEESKARKWVSEAATLYVNKDKHDDESAQESEKSAQCDDTVICKNNKDTRSEFHPGENAEHEELITDEEEELVKS